MKKLKNILQSISLESVSGNTDIEINSIELDSRNAVAGTLFVAIDGTQVDGHKFIDKAIENGAVAILCEKTPDSLADNVCYIKTENSSKTLSKVASAFYGNPSEKLTLVGVTGTNGKTTIATLLFDLFSDLGFPCGLLSTVENRVLNRVINSTHTTPNAIELNKLLNEMVEQGCAYCFIEVSSHAIAQDRVGGLSFDGGIFTNITHEHLDYHKTFKAYIETKKQFFDNLPKSAFALTNIDDKNGMVMLQNTKATKNSYSVRSMADFRCRILENHFDGLLLNVNGNEAWFRLVGKFNASNLIAIYGAARLLGIDSDEILKSLSSLGSVEGRFDSITENGRTAIVDYAHTPDALKNVLSTINEIRDGGGSLISVVGAGGDRDKTKRPEMATIAAEMSTQLILTSDNPRTENPEAILDDMENGLDPVSIRKMLRISNRKEAIRAAVRFSKIGDVILVAGKGHEKYQEIDGVKHPFDDKEILKNELIQLDK